MSVRGGPVISGCDNGVLPGYLREVKTLNVFSLNVFSLEYAVLIVIILAAACKTLKVLRSGDARHEGPPDQKRPGNSGPRDR